MATQGRPAYEISNYAKKGYESQHNLAYWRYEDYGGIGPGAHGRLSIDGKPMPHIGIVYPKMAKSRGPEGHGQQDTPLVTQHASAKPS